MEDWDTGAQQPGDPGVLERVRRDALDAGSLACLPERLQHRIYSLTTIRQDVLDDLAALLLGEPLLALPSVP